jgi:uncharacterized protein
MSSNREKWKFHAHPLMTNGHLQTVMGIHWPRRYQPYRAEKRYVPLDDGDKIVLHEDSPDAENKSLPLVLMIHGLTGSHESTYMRRMVEKLTPRGYRCIRMDMRGCGAGEAVARLPTHCGRWPDVATVLQYLSDVYPDRAVQIVGFSMGGTLSLNMLAEMGHMPVGNLERTLAISPPIDLVHVERHFRSKLGRYYDKFFVRQLWNQNLTRLKLHPDVAPAELPPAPRRLRELDEIVTAPNGGFRSAEDYYVQTSPAQQLASIRQPVTIFSSEDDPIVPFDPLLRHPLSAWIELITTARGGHLGFMARRNGDPDFRWLDWRIIDWLEQKSPSPSVGKSSVRQAQTQTA